MSVINVNDYVSYHGSLPEAHGLMLVVETGRRLRLRGFGTRADVKLANVNPTSVTVVKPAPVNRNGTTWRADDLDAILADAAAGHP